MRMAARAMRGPMIPRIPGNFLDGNFSLADIPLAGTILLFSSG
jgi:hypothetical protein